MPDGHAAGRIHRFSLPPGEHRLRAAHHLGGGRWFVWYSRDVVRDPRPNGTVLEGDGKLCARFHVGSPYITQVADDGTIWIAYSDEGVYGGGPPGGHGLVALDASGTLRFRWSHHAVSSGLVYPIWSADGLNVASSSEVWVAFAEVIPLKTRGFDLEHVLVHLTNGGVARVWPWSVASEKAPVRWPDNFALSGDGLLAQGSYNPRWPRPAPDDDRDRLYWVSLTSMRSMELLPVDERGQWIGPFRTEGRGSQLYLETEQSLFVVDASSLPAL
jgi:hypothetical protein